MTITCDYDSCKLLTWYSVSQSIRRWQVQGNHNNPTMCISFSFLSEVDRLFLWPEHKVANSICRPCTTLFTFKVCAISSACAVKPANKCLTKAEMQQWSCIRWNKSSDSHIFLWRRKNGAPCLAEIHINRFHKMDLWCLFMAPAVLLFIFLIFYVTLRGKVTLKSIRSRLVFLFHYVGCLSL